MTFINSTVALLALIVTTMGIAVHDIDMPATNNGTTLWDNWVAPPCDIVTCCKTQQNGHCTLGLWLSWKDEPMRAYIWDSACKVIGYQDGLEFAKETSVSSELPGYVVIIPRDDYPSEFWYLGHHYQNGWKDQAVTENHYTWYDRKQFKC